MRILCGGFGHDPERASRGEPVAFSGCYFAATGRSADRRAFLEGVFDKLNEEQDSVEWTKEACGKTGTSAAWGGLGILVIVACGARVLASHFLLRMVGSGNSDCEPLDLQTIQSNLPLCNI